MEWIFKYWIEALFGAVLAALGIAYRSMLARMRAEKAERDAMREGIKALLRDRILQCYDAYAARGEWPVYARDSAATLYHAYTALGGNGTVKQLMDQLNKLPTERRAA